MKDPSIIHVHSLLDQSTQTEIDGKWVPARPLGFSSILYRFRAAWLVWTGRADALIWHKQ
jgi:hypothetical protein